MNSFRRFEASVLSNQPVAEQIHHLVLEMDSDLDALPGQFVSVLSSAANDPLLRRPLGIAGWDHHHLELIYKIKGRGTQNLQQCRPGNQLDLLFPLGNPFPSPSPDWQNLVLVAGGVGLPPLLYYLRYYQNRLPAGTSLVMGSRDSASMLDLPELDKLPINRIMITQEKSSYHQGLVTDYIKDLLDGSIPNTVVLTCGPEMMMKKLQSMIMDHPEVSGFASLEDYMGCGFGVCNGCVHPIREDSGIVYRKVCTDGPVFDLKRIIWPD
ncbi:MAG: dihydroorotate dehydrogenase electron transfer subunit [Candidatus Delongbacteria bacterium]|nr:dihydroorotate dehydrogenase electron transfer subunit [Candidatus Delongbacteria bacterium]